MKPKHKLFLVLFVITLITNLDLFLLYITFFLVMLLDEIIDFRRELVFTIMLLLIVTSMFFVLDRNASSRITSWFYYLLIAELTLVASKKIQSKYNKSYKAN